MSKICEAFSKNVKKYRTQRGMSQEELAHQTNLDRTYISGIERGVRNPTLKVLEQIATALDVQACELITIKT